MLPFGMLNAFLVIQDGRAILVDTGLPRASWKVEQALQKQGLGWADLSLIVVTHGHFDHAGSAARIREKSKAPAIAHEADVGYCQGRAPVLRPTGTFGRLFRTTGVIERPFQYFTPDIAMAQNEMDLAEYGVAARLVHTPGHTPGSVSVVLETGDVIAGDLAASGVLLGGVVLKNRPKQPPFEESSGEVAESLRRLLACGGERFHLGHGGPLSAERTRAHVAYLDASAR